MITHLSEYDMRPNGRQKLSICGLWIDGRTEFALPTTCQDCLRIVGEREAEDIQTARALAAEFPEMAHVLMTEGRS